MIGAESERLSRKSTVDFNTAKKKRGKGYEFSSTNNINRVRWNW